jgi:hypothetical protein
MCEKSKAMSNRHAIWKQTPLHLKSALCLNWHGAMELVIHLHLARGLECAQLHFNAVLEQVKQDSDGHRVTRDLAKPGGGSVPNLYS